MDSSEQKSGPMESHCYFIATSWGDNPVPRHFMALSKELVRRGHQVVILVDNLKQVEGNYRDNPIVYTWPSKRPVKLRDARFLYRLVRKYQPECLIANFGAENVMLLVGLLMRVPCRIAWYHTLSAQIDTDAGLSRWKVNLLRLRKRIVYRAATHIVANSRASREDVQRVFRVSERKCRVFYNSLADPLEDVDLPQDAKKQKLICVGRLHPSKGQDVMLRAMVLLRQVLPDAYIEFIGDGPCRASYIQLAHDLGVEDRCIFGGSINHHEVLTRMASSVVTVVPSRSEAFGLVNIESLAVGTPVIASSVDGIVEIIRDGMDGFLVPPEDPGALAKRIETLLSNPELRQAMSANAREHFLSQFEQKKIVEQQAEWLESLDAC